MMTRRAHCPVGAFAVALACLMLPGCAVGPDYHPPAVAVPAGFAAAPAPAPAEAGRWWQAFHDPQLDALVERAVAGNPDVEVALTRVQEARLERIVVLGGLLPTLDASAAAAIGSGDDLTRGRADEELRSGDHGAEEHHISKIGGFETAWELDLFGKGRRKLEAAGDDAEARQDRRRAVLNCVIAEVVRAYVEVRILQLRLQIARSNVAEARRLVNLRLARPDPAARASARDGNPGDDDDGSGDADSGGQARRGPGKHERRPDNTDGEETPAPKAYDINIGGADVAVEAARVSEIEQRISAAVSRLVMLAGASEPEIAGALAGPGRVPRLPARLRPGTPLDLLRRRPDIRAAERDVAAATARIGVATAELFPTVSVAASVGAQGPHDEEDVEPGVTVPMHGPIWSFGPDAYWRVLDFGRLDALIGIKEMQAHAALASYRKTIIDAVAEVNEAVRKYHQGMQAAQALRVAVVKLRRAMDITEARWLRGETDFETLLDVQRRCHFEEDDVMEAAEVSAMHFVKFHQALGAGWEFYDALPPLPPTQPAVIAAVTRFLSGWRRD